MSILILEGDPKAGQHGMNVLGQFVLAGLESRQPGDVKMEVTFHIDKLGVLSVTARDLDTQKHERWLHQGHMEVHHAP